MTTHAERSTLKKLKLEFLECREYGHAWHHVRDEQFVTNVQKVVVQCTKVDECLRCTMIRRGVFEVPSWDQLGTYAYDAPPGYPLEPNEDGHRTTRAEIRAESGNRRNRKFRVAAAAVA